MEGPELSDPTGRGCRPAPEFNGTENTADVADLDTLRLERLGTPADRAEATPARPDARQPTAPVEKAPGGNTSVRRREAMLYGYAAVLTAGVVTAIMRLWRATLSVPFAYFGDAVASASYFKDVIQVGWYENQPHLGAPYGQHYHDYPFADDLQPAMAKVLSLFTDNWAVAFNGYYLLGFVLCALTAVWFFRVCGLGRWTSVVLAVLYAVTPYHFIRGQNHLFLASYYCVPLAMVLVIRSARGEGLWGRRRRANPIVSVLTGRGAGTVVILALVVYSSAYYGVFTALLLACGGAFGLLRSWSWRRLAGVLAAGVTLLFFFLLAMVPDLVYARVHGPNPAALFRLAKSAEIFALKFTPLVLPAPGHPILAFANFRLNYDTSYSFNGERPALGLIGAIGFLMLLSVALVTLTGRIMVKTGAAATTRRTTLLGLSFLSWMALAIGTIGGLGTVVSFFTTSIRGWNRISIFIVLLALAGVGLAVEAWGSRLSTAARARAASPPPLGSSVPTVRRRGRIAVAATPVLSVIVLLLGVADQSLTLAVPPYEANKTSYVSDQQYVDRIQGQLPADSMIFILPWQGFPETGRTNGISESDQLKLWLHSTTLSWSGGGMKGRPQTDWPAAVVRKKPAEMVRDLAGIGFVGISINRAALADHGARWESTLRPLLGAPTLISSDQKYSYLNLRAAIEKLNSSTTPAERAAMAAVITHIPPSMK